MLDIIVILASKQPISETIQNDEHFNILPNIQCKYMYIAFMAGAILYLADSAHITIHEMQYDSYQDTLIATK